MVVLYMIMNSDFSLNTLLDMLIPVLREKFPDSLFNMEHLIDSEISLNSFVEKFSNLCKNEKIDNYADINWDGEKKDFIVEYYSLDEITQIIFNAGDKKNARKRKKKKGENRNIEGETKNKNDDLKNNDINLGHNNSNNKNSQIPSKVMDNNSIVNSGYKENKNEDKEKKINVKIQEKTQNEIITDNAKDKNIQNNEITNELNITLIGQSENKNKINERNEAEIDLKKKYDELFKEIQKMKENSFELEKKNNKKFKKLQKLSDSYQNKINNLSGLLVNSTQRIEELDYNMKMIGLRTAFKAFIDLLIHILKINENGNLISKVYAVKIFMNKKNNKYINKLIEMLDDLLDILSESNYKAHYIDFKANLTSQLLEILGKNTNPHKYDIISEIINAFDVEILFKELMKLRTDKYKIDSKVYLFNEKNILNKIRNNPPNEKGLNFLMSFNSSC